MARFTLHQADLEQSRQQFKEEFQTTTHWQPQVFGAHISNLSEDIAEATTSLQDAYDAVEAVRSDITQEAPGKIIDADQVVLANELLVLIDDLKGKCKEQSEAMDETASRLLSYEAVINLDQRMEELIQESDPNDYEELQAQIKKIVDDYEEELEQAKTAYQSDRESNWCDTGKMMESADDIKGKLSNLEESFLKLGTTDAWYAILHEKLQEISSLPEDPATEEANFS